MSYPQREPAAFVARNDAGLLRQVLTEAFGSPTDVTTNVNGNGKRTGTVMPGHEALRAEQTIMIREDRELLAESARLNTAMAPLAIRIMDGSASAAEQQDYARRLIAAGEKLLRRGDGMGEVVVEGEVVVDRSLALPAYTVERLGVVSDGGEPARWGYTDDSADRIGVS